MGQPREVEIQASQEVVGPSQFPGHTWLESVRFESASRLRRIEESAFSGSDCHSVLGCCSGEVELFCLSSFRKYRQLESVLSEPRSGLKRIEDSAFSLSGLKSIEIPSLVVVLVKSTFRECHLIASVCFEIGCLLERIEESIMIPSSVVILGKESFYQ
jgi:hypothetical protein